MTLQLASASEEVKMWDIKENSCEMILKTTSSIFSHPVTSLSWNHTNQVIAVACDTPTKISLLQSSTGQLLSSVPFVDINAIPSVYESQPVKTLCFSHNSRYLACGIGGHVHLWDLKRRNLRFNSGINNMTVKGQIQCISFLTDANDIISGDSNGYIRLWNNKTSMSSSSISSSTTESSSSLDLLYKDNTGVNCLQIPSLGSSKVAAGYEDGSLVIWDITSSSQVKAQTVHRSPLTALAFSPKNSRLVATVGLDGNLTLIDIASKNTSSSVPSASLSVGSKIHSLAFHEDAIHTAVGTSDGYVIFYDWRNVKKPVVKIEAHSSTVYDLKFQVFTSATKSSTTIAVPASVVKNATTESPDDSPVTKQDSGEIKALTFESSTTTITTSSSSSFSSQLDISTKPKDMDNSIEPPKQSPKVVSSFIGGSLSRITEMFPVTPSRSTSNSQEAPKPKSFAQEVKKDEITERLSKLGPDLISSSTTTTTIKDNYQHQTSKEQIVSAADLTLPKTSSVYDTIKVNSIGNIQSAKRASISKDVSDKSMFKKEEFVVQQIPSESMPFSIDNTQASPTADELRQQYGLPSKAAIPVDNQSLSSISSKGLPAPKETDEIQYESNPMLGKNVKYEIDGYEDNPMHTRSPKISIDVYEDNPMHVKIPPPSKETSSSLSSPAIKDRRMSSPKPLIKSPIMIRQDPNYISNEFKQSISSDNSSPLNFKTPTKRQSVTKNLQQQQQQPAHEDFAKIYRNEPDEFENVKKAVRPVTNQELDKALELLKYDLHKDMKLIVKEVVRQFEISREETAQEVKNLSEKLNNLLKANQELREENERLRRIY